MHLSAPRSGVPAPGASQTPVGGHTRCPEGHLTGQVCACSWAGRRVGSRHEEARGGSVPAGTSAESSSFSPGRASEGSGGDAASGGQPGGRAGTVLLYHFNGVQEHLLHPIFTYTDPKSYNYSGQRHQWSLRGSKRSQALVGSLLKNSGMAWSAIIAPRVLPFHLREDFGERRQSPK
ncbi:hypothetical protein NDU88_001339 [Pleurodeles waltl]|uniref:Uncharacterized protein n=1 Tax=Pleurodeles waltl TaxID=8319 RepID=A0AAV7R8A3_PLEWA|nr:hypothetical protein NDU88_001339 [Pleurodeles waltl]